MNCVPFIGGIIIIIFIIIVNIMTGYQDCWPIMKEIDIAPGGPVIKLQLFSYPLIKEKKTTFPLSRVKKKCTAARLKRIDVHYEGFKKI